MQEALEVALQLIVAMKHTNNGVPKIVNEFTLPLTGRKYVKLLVTELGVFDFQEDGINLIEIAKGITLDDLISLKKNFFMLKDYDDFLDNEQYQESLQTLKSEVRNHIKIQKQLKLFMEMQKSKFDEVAKNSKINEIEIMEQIKSYEKETRT